MSTVYFGYLKIATVRYMYEGESRLISKVTNLCCLNLRFYKTDIEV